MKDLVKLIKYEKIENKIFRISSYVSATVATVSSALSIYLYKEDYSNALMGSLLVTSVGYGVLGHALNGAAKKGQVIVENLEKRLRDSEDEKNQ